MQMEVATTGMKQKMGLAEFDGYCRGRHLQEIALCSVDQDKSVVNSNLCYALSYNIILINPFRKTVTLRGDTGYVTFVNVMGVFVEKNKEEGYDIAQIMCNEKGKEQSFCLYIFSC